MHKGLDDIIPPEHRSIRKVSVSRGARRPLRERVEPTPHSIPSHSRRGNYRWGLWVVAVVAILGLVFGFSFLFSGAKVIVTPKQRSVLVDTAFQATRNPSLNTVGYEVMTIEREGQQNVEASGDEYVEKKASGQIVIYNNYNSSSQRLIKNTRFKTSDGRIYRINDEVTVPGQHIDSGSKVPGSLEVTVYADEPGDTYNIGLSDFTIPGFEGSPRYEAFYARSKTEMTGGFVGTQKVVSENDETEARAKIQKDLKAQLQQEALSQKPEGFELYPDGIFVVFSSLPNTEDVGKVTIREKATLYGVLLNQKDFARLVATNTIAGFDGEPIEVVDPSTLTFSIDTKSGNAPWEGDSFTFNLKGNAHLVWSFDSDKLKEDLAGKSKGALETVLTGYSSIDQAQIILRPFWQQTFPEKVGDIKIVKQIEG